MTEHKYYNSLEIGSQKADFCLTTAIVSCDGKVSLDYYAEYLNEESAWDATLSLEDQGLPWLLVLAVISHSVVFLIYWQVIGESEDLGAHSELILAAKAVYWSAEVELLLWLCYYWSYLHLGTPAVLLKCIACYVHWVYELAVVTLLALHATGYFLRSIRAAAEVKIVLVGTAGITLYLAALRSWESEELVQFHWIAGGRCAFWLRLCLALCQVLWAGRGFILREDGQRELFGLLSYGGLLWTLSQAGILWVTGLMMPYRWKYYQAFGSLCADISFSSFLLVFIHRDSALVIFSNEDASRSLKKATSL